MLGVVLRIDQLVSMEVDELAFFLLGRKYCQLVLDLQWVMKLDSLVQT